jgi:hypothetical protein
MDDGHLGRKVVQLALVASLGKDPLDEAGQTGRNFDGHGGGGGGVVVVMTMMMQEGSGSVRLFLSR